MAGNAKVTSKVANQSLDDFLGTLHKKAEANTEPGSQDGSSTHPTADADDSTQTAPEGEQSKDNTKQVKEMIGAPAVDNAKEAKIKAPSLKSAAALSKKKADVGDTGTAEGDQLQIGTKKTPTGDDPSKETGMTTAGYPDPGTEHPAAVDNSELDGAKYANEKTSFVQDLQSFVKLADGYFNNLQHLQLEVAPKTAAVAVSTATKAGAAVADAVIDNSPLNEQMFQLGQHKLAELLFDGMQAGALVADHYDAIVQQNKAAQAQAKKLAATRKRANPEMGMDPAMGAMGGGAEMGGMGGEMGGEMGGAPPMPPEAGGGAPGGGEGGSVLDSIDPETLVAILEELGINPEDLQGGGGGGADVHGAARRSAGAERRAEGGAGRAEGGRAARRARPPGDGRS